MHTGISKIKPFQ